MAKTERFLVTEQDQEIVRFNERLRQLRALSPEQRTKHFAARVHELRACSRLANDEGQQQHQQTLEEGSLNEASKAIAPDIPNAAAQAELLRAEQLSLQHNSRLAFYAQAKAQ